MMNSEYLRRRKRELGLSDRALARQIGINLPKMQKMLEGHHHGTLTLQQLDRLAAALACDLTALFELATDEPPAPPSTTAKLAALLHTAQKAVPITVLADATNMTLEQVKNALKTLDQHLQYVGLRIHHDTNGHGVHIVPDTTLLTDTQIQTVLRGAANRIRMDDATSKLLYRIITDGITRKAAEASNDGRVRVGQLINAGIIKEPTNAKQHLEVTDDVRESLLLDVR